MLSFIFPAILFLLAVIYIPAQGWLLKCITFICVFYQDGSWEQAYWISSLSLKVASDKGDKRKRGEKRVKFLEHVMERP